MMTSKAARPAPLTPSRAGATTTTVTDADRAHMRRALELARRGLGATYPNPAVGCVIVSPQVGCECQPRPAPAAAVHATVWAVAGHCGTACSNWLAA